MYSHILISTDGSELAKKGVDHGLSLAKRLGAKATIITVTEPFPIYATAGTMGVWPPIDPKEYELYEATQTEAAAKVLAAIEDSAEKLGVPVETVHVLEKRPAEAIIDTAKTRGCDLIVMASHGRRGLGRLLLGSQTSEVVAYGQVPVLVVR
ncbi:MAG: universal stress protein [Phyllobacterium sp.]|uniref:universal stress protein n=1 Tax=Phyllobacterium sp. TaxID=1871046 RepID=UPI0030F1C44C